MVKKERIIEAPIPTESEEQRTFFELARLSLKPDIFDLLWATPNGGLRDIRVATTLKSEGVKAGVPDITLAYPTDKYHGLFIELKRQKGGRTSKEQEHMIRLLRERGYRVEVCKGCNEAIATLASYLGIKNPIQ